MDRNAKKAVLKNRVKLLSLDYFDLTAPLLASEIFTSAKHKEIKNSAGDSKARVDLLLEWLDDSAPKEAFPHFLQGIKNCDEAMLAKRIKKEAEEGVVETKKPRSGGAARPKMSKPVVPTASSIALDKFLADIIPSLPASITSKAASTSPDKPKKPKKPKTGAGPSVGAPATATAGPTTINGLPSLPPPPVPVAKKRKAEGDVKPKIKLPKVIAPVAPKASPANSKSAAKAKTPNKQNGAKTDNAAVKVEPGSRASTPKNTAASQAAAAAAAAAAQIMASTPRTTRKSSSSDIVRNPGRKAAKKPEGKKQKQDKKGTTAASASPANAKNKAAKVTVTEMTFKEVEEKQLDFKNKFKFTNSNAVARSSLFKDKSDITYLGCPFMVNNKMCGKKVELKSKEFVCEAKHKSPNCRQIPRLQVTCNDGTADLILTLMKQNVEIFTGKSETEIETMSVDDIKVVLDKATGKKLNVEVASEKAKKQGIVKKGTPARWSNVATIIDNDNNTDAPPNKKKRKN